SMDNREHTSNHSNMENVMQELEQSVGIAKKAGGKDEQIILEPGIGFGKTLADNYTVLGQMEKITNQLSYPLLLGTSRKSFITEVLDIPAEQRDNATGATTCIGIQKGANIIRVHDVKRHRDLASMTERILQGASTVG